MFVLGRIQQCTYLNAHNSTENCVENNSSGTYVWQPQEIFEITVSKERPRVMFW